MWLESAAGLARQGIGNGLPLAAVVTTPEIAATLAQRLHFNTFGGNPVCCAGGREVLRVIDDEGIQANAHAVCCAVKCLTRACCGFLSTGLLYPKLCALLLSSMQCPVVRCLACYVVMCTRAWQVRHSALIFIRGNLFKHAVPGHMRVQNSAQATSSLSGCEAISDYKHVSVAPNLLTGVFVNT